MIKSTLLLLSEKILRLLVTFFISVWFARYLGPDDFGKFAYVMSFGALLLPFYLMGASETAIKALKDYPEEHHRVMGSTFKLKIVGGGCGLLLGVLLCYLLKGNGITLYVTSLFLTVMLCKSLENISDFFQAELNIKFISMSRNLVLIIVNIIKVILILMEKDWIYFIYLSCFDIAVIIVFYIFQYKRCGLRIRDWKFDQPISMKQTYVPFFLISFFVVAINKTDHLMIEYYLGTLELGNYAVMSKFLEMSLFIPMAFLTSIYPVLLKRYKSESYVEVKSLTYSIIINLSIYATLFFLFLGPRLINGLYGSRYEQAASFISVYGLGLFFIFMLYLRNKIYAVENCLKLNLYNLVATFVINVILNIVLIPQFGVIGAVYASVISYAASYVIFIICVKSFRVEFIFVLKTFFYIYSFRSYVKIRSMK